MAALLANRVARHDLPGLALMATVLAINFFGDGLRDVLDPGLRV